MARRNRRWGRWKWAAVGGAIGLLIPLCHHGPYLLEPTSAAEYVHVEVAAYRLVGGGRQYFTVVSPASGQSWEVGAARGPFTFDYRGPAVLAVRRGRWTGKDHLRLLERAAKTDTPNQAMQLTAVSFAIG